jgi:hypothetical protein
MKTKVRVAPTAVKSVVADEREITLLNQAAELIRRLPGVLRVQVNLDALQVEVLYKQPTEVWLREVHLAASSLNSTMATLLAYCS